MLLLWIELQVPSQWCSGENAGLVIETRNRVFDPTAAFPHACVPLVTQPSTVNVSL